MSGGEVVQGPWESRRGPDAGGEAPGSLEAVFANVRAALRDRGVPQEGLGEERESRWRGRRIARIGAVWHLGVLLLTDDAVLATGEVLRAAEPVRRGYPTESARVRAERRAEAVRGGFEEGEVVHYAWTVLDLGTVAAGGDSGPLSGSGGQWRVRWSAAGALRPLEEYLREQLSLIG